MNDLERELHQEELNDKITRLLNGRIKILIDLDDTIEQLVPCWIEELNYKYGCNVQYEDVKMWNISQYFPFLSEEEVFSVIRNEEFWKKVKPKADAVKYVKKLIDEGYDVYICTSTYYKNIQPKYEYFIKRYFPFIEWNRFIVCHNKQMIKADYLIDDFPNNLINGDFTKILVDTPYNRDIDDESYGIVRFSDWKSIYEFISKK